MAIWIIVLITTFVLVLVDQIGGLINVFKVIKSEEDYLTPLSKRYLKRRLIGSILLPMLMLEIVIFAPYLGYLINPFFYLLAVLPLIFIYSISISIRNINAIKYHVENDKDLIIGINDNLDSLIITKKQQVIELTNDNVQEINVLQPMLLMPPNNLIGFAKFVLTNGTEYKISLITLGDPIILKKIFPTKIKKSRSWTPVIS